MIIRTYQEGDETAIVALLEQAYPDGWGGMEKWRQHHGERAGFESSDITIAEKDGRIVGCLHTACYEQSLGRGITVLAAVDGDLAVDPDHRGGGIPEQLYRFSSEKLIERGVLIRQGYSESEVRGHFYTRVLGYSSGLDRTEAWMKYLTVAPALDRIRRRLNIGPRETSRVDGPVLQVTLTDLPPIQFALGPGQAGLVSGCRPSLGLRAPQSILSLFSEPRTSERIARLGKDLIQGRFAVSHFRVGALMCLVRLARYALIHRIR